MTTVFEVLRLASDYASARAALRAHVERAMALQPYRMPLHLEVGRAALHKVVLVTFSRDANGTHFDEVWAIRWTPEHGGPFPDFRGYLSVQYASDGRAQLEIRGEYAPPLGALGRGFDLIAGQRIASLTCRNVLADFALRIERHGEEVPSL